MRARPGKFLSLYVAIALSAALAVPSGFAFGGGAAAAGNRVERRAAARTPVATGGIRRRVSGIEPVAPAAQRSSALPVVEAGVSHTAESTFVVDPLAPAVPGELVVVLDSSAVATSTERALEARGAEVERADGSSSLVVKTPLSVSTPLFTQLAADTPGVAWVQPNYIYRGAYVPSDPMYYPAQWGLASIAATAAWDVTKGTNTVVVAVVDTGVDYYHPDLAGRVDTENDYDFVNGDLDAFDDNGHGTHVSGIVAATMDNAIGVTGVAPECRILPVKVLSAAGWGDSAGVAAGIQYAADHGAKVINLSLEGTADRLMGAAVVYARSKGCLVVAAVGNDGSSTGASYPARYPGVVGVGAADRYGARASFSNYGTGVDVAAPGVGVFSTLPGDRYGNMSGTSMASPFVAGVAALLFSSEPSLDATAAIQRIFDSAVQTASAWTAHGLLNAAAALGPAPPRADADIPGIALSTSPVSGNLSAVSDRVYSVYLGSGQTLAATLTAGPVSLDLGLYLYSPSSQTIATGTRVAFDVGPDDPKTIRYVATVAGRYYIDVRAFEGEGSCQLDWARTGTSDDEIPGVPAPSSPVVGNVSESADQDDVYSVRLAEHDLITVQLTGPSDGTDMDVYLYGPDATSVFTDVSVAGSNVADTASEWFRYRVPKAGTYYLDVMAFSGGGDYTVDYLVAPGAPTDNIPGIEPTVSPVVGAIGGRANSDDVYKLYLQAGQSVDLTMTTAHGTGDYYYPWLTLYPTTATDVDVDADWGGRLGFADSETGVAHITHEATSTGYFYVDLYDPELGAPVAYELVWHTTKAQDDNLPGVTAPPSPVNGALGPTTDTDDVYRVHAHAGQWISASLTGAPSESTDFDLYLYSRDAPTRAAPRR
jgi:thermitase